ncbi:cell wall-binding repeat-containing protein, partial [Microvirga sp. 3-52]|nr:cell wall-binding repeat-containing protein [Microvirga sp. 3-52]
VAFDKEVTTEVSVEPGKNVFELKVIDIAGNTTIKEVEVYRESVSRVSGSDRFDTSVEVSKKGWESAETVVLARGDDYADALAGVPYAHKLNAPILLTGSKKVYDSTLDELKRLGTKKVVLLGGESAISKAVETQLAADFEVERVAGKNRFDTAAKIAT